MWAFKFRAYTTTSIANLVEILGRELEARVKSRLLKWVTLKITSDSFTKRGGYIKNLTNKTSARPSFT